MKKLTLFIFNIFLISNIFSQTFDMELERVAEEMANELNSYNELNIAVYPFYNKDKVQSDLSRLVAEDFSIYLNNYNNSFKIIDRAFMEQMLEEHQLNQEGLINPETAKEFGMIIAADVYITGKVFVFGNNIRFQTIAINTETGERVYSDYKKLPLEYDIAEFAGINDIKKRVEKEEMYKSANPKCAEKQVGDFCFVNKLNVPLYVRVSDTGIMPTFFRNLSISANQKACFKDLPANKSLYYQTSKSSIVINDVLTQGEFQVKTCKSDFVIIR